MVELLEAERVGTGQFADVFRSGVAGRVVKLYRSAGDRRWRKWADQIHKEEIAAFETAAAEVRVCGHTAKCFGQTTVERVLSADGIDISDRYLLHNGITLEELHGNEEKAAGLPRSRFPHVYTLLDAFDEIGIDAGDASVFGYERSATMKFVDITTFRGAQLFAALI